MVLRVYTFVLIKDDDRLLILAFNLVYKDSMKNKTEIF